MSVAQLVIWKAVAVIFILVVVVQQFLGQYNWVPTRVRNHLFPADSHGSPHQSWTFQSERDRYNHGLSDEQCIRAFPNLFVEIDRSLSHWQDRLITPESIDLIKGNDGNVRILIHNQQLRVVQTRGLRRPDFRHRILAIVHQVHRAITAAEANNEPIPDIEFNVVVDDYVNLSGHDDRAFWSFSRAFDDKLSENNWLIPDFHFWAPDFHKGGGSFQEMQLRSRSYDSDIKDKIRKVAWRGVEWTAPKLRGALLKATAKKPWADVQTIDWKNKSSVMNMDEFCQYAFLVNTEGRSWSARLAHILNCNSVPVVHDTKWHTHYNHLLKNGTNCIHVQRDFSDLEQQMLHYSEHIEEAQAIADKSVETFRDRYTSPAATSCYWRELFRGWAKVAFTPDAYLPASANETRPNQRGISFEEFIVHLNNVEYPYTKE